MRIELSSGRKFNIKVAYNTVPKSTHHRDEFGRDIYIDWEEKDTYVTISEWFTLMPNVSTNIVGKSHCHYQDTFDKRLGRDIAYFRAINEMRELGIINDDEMKEMETFELNMPYYSFKHKK